MRSGRHVSYKLGLLLVALVLARSMHSSAEAQQVRTSESPGRMVVAADVKAKDTKGIRPSLANRNSAALAVQPGAPILVSPPNGATNQPTDPILVWDPVPTGISYHVQVAIDPTFSGEGGVVLDSYTDVTRMPVFELANNTTYYWRVQAMDSTESLGPYSETWVFITVGILPGPPILISPLDGATNQPTSLILEWEPVPGATSYRVQVATDAKFQTGIVLDDSTVTGITALLTGLTNNTTYYWHVNAKDSAGAGPYSATWNFSTTVAPPEPPALISPPNGATDQPTTLLLVWSQVPTVTSYRVQVATDPNFQTGIVLDDPTVVGTSTLLAGLTTNTTYYWHVNASNTVGVSSFSATWNFSTVVVLPAAPTLVSPPNGATSQPTTLILVWNQVPTATSYRVQVATDSNFVTRIFLDDSTVVETSILLSGLTNNTTYYWHVNATNRAGASPYSSKWSFSTSIVLPAAPTLVSPPNGATNQPTQLTLVWNQVAAATSYRVQVATDPDFVTGIVVDDPTVVGTTIPVTGLPTNTTYYWHVNATNTSGVSPYSATWSFRTIAAPLFSVAPRAIAFGNVALSTSRQDSVTVRNTGTGSLNIISVTSTSGEYVVFPFDGIITGAESLRFYITFTPESAGLSTGQILFTHNGPTSPDSITVTGTGVVPAFSMTKRSIAYGDVAVGTSKRDSVTVMNLGNSALRVSSVTSNDAQFTVLSFSGSIAPSDSQIFYITFTPTSSGLKTADIVFTHSAGTSPDTLRVTGTGVLPAMSLSRNSISFGDVEVGTSSVQNITLTNIGKLPVLVDSVGVRGANAGEFAIVGSHGPFSLPLPLDSVSITVRFSPVTGGNKSAVFEATSNANSSPDTSVFSGVATVSTLLVSLTGDTLSGSSLGVTVTPPASFQSTGGWLFYRSGGRKTYDSLALTQTGGAYQGAIPPNALDLRGVEYYVSILGQVPLTFPRSDPANNPAVVRVKVANALSSLFIQPGAYKMISVPAELGDSNVGGVLLDDYGTYDRTRWRLFRWQGEDYLEYPDIKVPFAPGNAFWLVTSSGVSFDIDNGKSVQSSNPYSIVLQQGWNQIACPFAFPVAWDGIAGSGQVKGPYFYDNGQYQIGIRVLRPWEGYFVYDSSGTVVLQVPPLEAPPTLARVAEPVTVNGDRDYVLQLSAAIEGTAAKDTYNYLGFIQDAGEGDDSYDMPEPPPIGDFVQLSIMNGQERFVSNFKPLRGEGEQWELKVRSTLANPRVHVTLKETGRLPEGYGVYILDEDQFNLVPVLENGFDIRLGKEGAVRSLKLVIGTKTYAEGHSGGIPLIPLENALEQNYPNPFNPETRIQYQLSKRSELVLEVYNLLGQHIRTLVREEQLTGSYSVVWNGVNDSGTPAASGVYIYRLRAGDYVAARKLLLVR